MKQTRAVIIATILTFFAFGAVLYTSCTKDHCKNMNCQNGGTCSNGFCLCPDGYTGTYCQTINSSHIALKNSTFTPVVILINGAERTIDSGETVVYTGHYGENFAITGTTHGAYGINVPIVPVNDAFPTRGTITHELDVDSTYFFLMATNNNPTVPYITQVHVNYMQRDSTLDITTIPNDSRIYHIGYYKAYDDTRVRLEKTPYNWNFNSLALPMTKNQYFYAVVN